MRESSLALAILFCISATALAENIRGPVTAVREVASEPVSLSMGVNDIAALQIGGETRFLKAVRLEVQVPSNIREFAGGLALYLYSNLAPTPEERVMTLTGTRQFFEGLPRANRFFVVVPTRSDHGLSGAADTFLVDPALSPEAFPIAFAILPVMKGLPSQVEEATFSIRAHRVLFNEGALQLQVVDSEGNRVTMEEAGRREFRIRLNGSELAYDTNEIVLAPGLHEVELVSEVYENRNVTVGIERGSVSTLVMELVRPRSRLTIEAPQGSEVFIDGSRLEEPFGQVTVSPGEHTVLFRVGDYTVSRNISVQPKRDYNISLSLDILVSEE